MSESELDYLVRLLSHLSAYKKDIIKAHGGDSFYWECNYSYHKDLYEKLTSKKWMATK